ncbi:hypothetical protein KKF34_13765 [Myxococcota bacterium]|nr:hypothetical protein [Myxococcota bacterium]MBU1382500.1 hypothetical protein [Myxococcota bacterium]MBU1497938.1 hypothetical protein [Myxococcota bacterium]
MKITFISLLLLFSLGCQDSPSNTFNNSNNTNSNIINNSNNSNNSNNTNTNNLNNSNNTNETDTDGDGVPDRLDPCPLDNPDDSDFDGVCDSNDKCPGGNDTIDTDGDGIPDFCDICPLDNPDDSDNDGVCDSDDACPGHDDNVDTDGDGNPDGCDICPGGDDNIDSDGDGVPDGCDICPLDNSDDSDNDGVCDSDDICPGGDDNIDSDGDGIPDFCDSVLPGNYTFTRIPAANINKLSHVAMGPDNSFFIALESYNRVLIYDLASSTYTITDIHTSSGNIYFEDLVFSPDGTYALFTGYRDTSTGDDGVVFRFDTQAWKAGMSNPAAAITEVDLTVNAFVPEAISAVVFATNGKTYISARKNSYSYIYYLFELDVDTGIISQLAASASSAGCQGMTEVNNEYGDWGLLTVCGINGYDAFYYTEVAGTGELRTNLGNNNLGNSFSTQAHPGGDYALVISWSGDAVYRFEAGLMNGYSDAPRFSTRRLRRVVFQPNGSRALILGTKMTISGNSFGTVIEFRDDFYSCPQPLTSNCDLTEVSIPAFGSAPWIAPDSTSLEDASWRKDCDGGIIVGGYSSYSTNYSFIATFQLNTGISCNW